MCTNSFSSRSIGLDKVPSFLDDFDSGGFVRSAIVVFVFFVTFETVVVSPVPLLALRFLDGMIQTMSVRMPSMTTAVRSILLAVDLRSARKSTRSDCVVALSRRESG